MADPIIHPDLHSVTDLMRDLSRISDPQELVRTYKSRAGGIIVADRTVSLSRRDLSPPQYRITRSDLWTHEIDPWKQRERLPLLTSGLMGELLYAGVPRIIDNVHLDHDDPGRDHFAQMASLVAIPHFDNGQAINMVIHLRRKPHGFDHAQLPEMVLLSGLFGRAMHGLVLAGTLRNAQDRLQDQYTAVSDLSDTILEQARALKSHATTLEDRVRVRTEELETAHLDAIFMLAAASEAKDDTTGDHIRRLQKAAYQLARQLGQTESAAAQIGRSAILHDVGKIHVPDHILKKPAPLTDEERTIMQNHTLAGEHILADRPYFAQARRIARSHHENWDGSGYPDGLSSQTIPFESQIVHLVDVYDALTHARPYKLAWKPVDALTFIREQAGRMFDPAMVEAFVAMQTNILHSATESAVRTAIGG